MSQRFSLSINSDVQNLAAVAEFVEQAAAASGLDQNQIYDVQMAVDEACTNIIQHAYHGRRDGTLDISCEGRGREFVVVIVDFGDPFDPKKVATPKTHDSLSRRSVGGLGIFFMRKLMDRVDFSFSSQQGNRLTMVKKIKK